MPKIKSTRLSGGFYKKIFEKLKIMLDNEESLVYIKKVVQLRAFSSVG